MNTTSSQRRITSRLMRYVPWVVLYLFIVGGTTVFGAKLYETYDTHQLPSGYIELAVDKTAYELGESVAFTVINHFPVPVFVMNQCPEEPLNVYRWEHDVWVQLHATARDEGECYAEDRNVGVPSEGSRGYTFDDWPDLFALPGVYRIAANIDHYPDVPFQDFVVRAPRETVEVMDPPLIRYVKETPAPVVPRAVPPLPPEPVVLEPDVEYIYEEYEYEDEDEEDDEEHEDEDEHEDEEDEDEAHEDEDDEDDD